MLRRLTGLFQPLSSFEKTLLAMASGVLVSLAFPSGNLWILAWVGFVPFLFAVGQSGRQAALALGYLAGLVYWSLTIYWLVHVTIPGTLVLIAYLALYFGAFAAVVTSFARVPAGLALLGIPAAWVALEYLRSRLLTGFPWALLGYSQSGNLAVIQIADITGVWGVSFLVMLVNVALWQVLLSRRSCPCGGSPRLLLVPILALAAALGYGFLFLSRTPTAGEVLKLAVIQGNIPQELKWNPRARQFIVDKYLDLSQEASYGRPACIIWPEAALPVIPDEEPRLFEQVGSFAHDAGLPLILGAVTSRQGQYYNSAILVSKEGRESGRYDKLHLVPFGEYIPLRRIFRFLETVAPIGDIAPGREYTLFGIPAADGKTVQAAVLICFEDLFPELSRRFARRGAAVLVNITNDAWYKETSAPYQHFQASVFRAVENRISLVRAANTGVSGVIAPSGRIISLVTDRSGRDIFVDGITSEMVPLGSGRLTCYGRIGDVFVWVCLALVTCGVIRLLFPGGPA